MQVEHEKGTTKQHDAPLSTDKYIGRHIAVHFQIHHEFLQCIQTVHRPFLVESKKCSTSLSTASKRSLSSSKFCQPLSGNYNWRSYHAILDLMQLLTFEQYFLYVRAGKICFWSCKLHYLQWLIWYGSTVIFTLKECCYIQYCSNATSHSFETHDSWLEHSHSTIEGVKYKKMSREKSLLGSLNFRVSWFLSDS